MSIIRYRFKADKNFESVKIDGMSCSLGELKRLIAAKSSRSGTYSKDDYDLIISNANTHEEYKDNSDLIPRNASVIVARRIRGSFDTLTPSTNQKPVVSSDDIIKGILLPAILNQNATTPSSTVVEANAIPLEQLTESASTAPVKEMTEDELIKEIQAGSQARYVTQQPPYRTNVFVCHNCKERGHIKSQCPLILQSSSSNNNSNSSSSAGHDGSQTGNSGSTRPGNTHSSHIVTRHAPYQIPYHHRGNRSHRGAGHPRGEPLPKKTTGIPRDRLIPVPKHIPGALRDQTGASVVPRQMAELYVERIERKADALAQIGRQSDDKNVSSNTTTSSSSRPTDEDGPPNDLLCPLCKQIFTDAVITPCCNLSFCDACIRTALIESSEHECPQCHCQHVAIDQINPNLYLRNHIKRWQERQNQSSYSHSSLPQQTYDQDNGTTSTNSNNLNETDEYDPTTPSTSSQPIVPSVKGPIIIKMQPRGKSQSPPMVATRPADMTFEDEKGSDSDQLISSQKDVKTNEETTDKNPPFITTPSEIEKSEEKTPPIQTPPISHPLYPSSSPSTPLPPTNPVVSHYYPPTPHPNVIYPHHIPPAAPPNGLYPIPQNYYQPPMGVRYPPAGIHHYPGYPPAPPVHHHHHPQPPPHPMLPAPHIPPNGYNMPGFHPHPTVPFTSTSTFIAHHQTATQPMSTALSENEFYIKQRYFQRIQRSPSPPRRSRSSSYSSYSSSDSRSSSRSRYNRRRRSSRSRSRSRSRRRITSPSREINNRRQRRSPSFRNRQRPIETKEKYSSKYRRSPPRPSRDQERRRTPRPPPTVQQSTQRTIVYMQESSHSTRDRRRSKSRSRGNDERSKKDQQLSQSHSQPHSQSESTQSSSSVVPTTLSSKIETVVEDKNDKTQEDNSKNEKKRKKRKKHHHRHHHSRSKSKKRNRSKDKEEKAIVDTPTTSVIEIQS